MKETQILRGLAKGRRAVQCFQDGTPFVSSEPSLIGYARYLLNGSKLPDKSLGDSVRGAVAESTGVPQANDRAQGRMQQALADAGVEDQPARRTEEPVRQYQQGTPIVLPTPQEPPTTVGIRGLRPAAPQTFRDGTAFVTDGEGSAGRAVIPSAAGLYAGQLPLRQGTAFIRAPKGVPKSGDHVPALLEHGEAVLPKKTVAKVGPANIARLIEATNNKPPKKGLRAGGGYDDGLAEEQKIAQAQQEFENAQKAKAGGAGAAEGAGTAGAAEGAGTAGSTAGTAGAAEGTAAGEAKGFFNKAGQWVGKGLDAMKGAGETVSETAGKANSFLKSTAPRAAGLGGGVSGVQAINSAVHDDPSGFVGHAFDAAVNLAPLAMPEAWPAVAANIIAPHIIKTDAEREAAARTLTGGALGNTDLGGTISEGANTLGGVYRGAKAAMNSVPGLFTGRPISETYNDENAKLKKEGVGVWGADDEHAAALLQNEAAQRNGTFLQAGLKGGKKSLPVDMNAKPMTPEEQAKAAKTAADAAAEQEANDYTHIPVNGAGDQAVIRNDRANSALANLTQAGDQATARAIAASGGNSDGGLRLLANSDSMRNLRNEQYALQGNPIRVSITKGPNGENIPTFTGVGAPAQGAGGGGDGGGAGGDMGYGGGGAARGLKTAAQYIDDMRTAKNDGDYLAAKEGLRTVQGMYGQDMQYRAAVAGHAFNRQMQVYKAIQDSANAVDEDVKKSPLVYTDGKLDPVKAGKMMDYLHAQAANFTDENKNPLSLEQLHLAAPTKYKQLMADAQNKFSVSGAFEGFSANNLGGQPVGPSGVSGLRARPYEWGDIMKGGGWASPFRSALGAGKYGAAIVGNVGGQEQVMPMSEFASGDEGGRRMAALNAERQLKGLPPLAATIN